MGLILGRCDSAFASGQHRRHTHTSGSALWGVKELPEGSPRPARQAPRTPHGCRTGEGSCSRRRAPFFLRARARRGVVRCSCHTGVSRLGSAAHGSGFPGSAGLTKELCLLFMSCWSFGLMLVEEEGGVGRGESRRCNRESVQQLWSQPWRSGYPQTLGQSRSARRRTAPGSLR